MCAGFPASLVWPVTDRVTVAQRWAVGKNKVQVVLTQATSPLDSPEEASARVGFTCSAVGEGRCWPVADKAHCGPGGLRAMKDASRPVQLPHMNLFVKL